MRKAEHCRGTLRDLWGFQVTESALEGGNKIKIVRVGRVRSDREGMRRRRNRAGGRWVVRMRGQPH